MSSFNFEMPNFRIGDISDTNSQSHTETAQPTEEEKMTTVADDGEDETLEVESD